MNTMPPLRVEMGACREPAVHLRNFVTRMQERIERAKADWMKADWMEGWFAPVPGETEFILAPWRQRFHRVRIGGWSAGSTAELADQARVLARSLAGFCMNGHVPIGAGDWCYKISATWLAIAFPSRGGTAFPICFTT